VIIGLDVRSVERVPLEPGYEALLLAPDAELLASDGDIVVLDGERLLVVQSTETRIEYIGMRGPTSRLLLLVRPSSAISVSRS
jgi:urease accessory protein UreE